MEKSKLDGFIKRYNLNGCIESVKVVSNEAEDSITTNFIADDRYVIGIVKLNGVNFGNVELGIYETARLKNMMAVLGSEIDIVPVIDNDRLVSLDMKDSNSSMTFMLCDTSVINPAPNLKKMPDWDVVINIDTNLRQRFAKAKSALPDCNDFILQNNKKTKALELVLGYSKTSTSNKISIKVDTEDGLDTLASPISFSAKHFKEILAANADSEGATLNVSSHGLAYIKFITDDYVSEYFLPTPKN
jgi:hypothetical protein